MALCVDVRVDADRDRGLGAVRGRDHLQPLELGGRFDVEAENPGLERGDDVLARFGDAGEHDAPGVTPGHQHAPEFAAGDDVETRAPTREQVQHREVRVRLDGIADQVRGRRGQRRREGVVLRLDRRARVDVDRSAEARGDVIQRDVLGAQHAVTVVESLRHGVPAWPGGVSGGRNNGPFWPQPASSATPSNVERMSKRTVAGPGEMDGDYIASPSRMASLPASAALIEASSRCRWRR